MQRREFIAIIGGASLAWPTVTRAQHTSARRIGILMSTTAEDPFGQLCSAAFARRACSNWAGRLVATFVSITAGARVTLSAFANTRRSWWHYRQM